MTLPAESQVTPEAAPAAGPSWRDIVGVILAPERVLAARLAEPPALATQLFQLVLPAAAIGGVAMFTQSLLLSAPFTGLARGAGSLALQVGTWLMIGLALPSLARQFQASISERHALLVVAFASMPLWLACVLYAVPDTVPFLYYWSRMLIIAMGAYGVYITDRALLQLGVRELRLPLVASISVAYLALYVVLFTILGVSVHLVLLTTRLLFGDAS